MVFSPTHAKAFSMSKKINHELIVGRDQAHVRELVKNYAHAQVISISSFFDRVRLLVYLLNPKITRDDQAPLMFAHGVLHEYQKFNLSLAPAFVSLYASILHGICTPKEILENPNLLSPEIKNIIKICDKIHANLLENNLVNGVRALYLSRLLIKEKLIIPPSLARVSKISFFYTVDLTNLELDIIKNLAKIGVEIKLVLPMNFYQRGINIITDYIAREFEQEKNLPNFELIFEDINKLSDLRELGEKIFLPNTQVEINQNNLKINKFKNYLEEVSNIANYIIKIKQSNKNSSVALVLGALDTKSKILKQELKRFGLKISERRGESLFHTSCGQLIRTILEARRNHLDKTSLVGLLSHNLSKFYIQNNKKLSEIISLVHKIASEDYIIPLRELKNRYGNFLKNSKNKIVFDFSSAEIISYFEEIIEKLCEILSKLKSQDSLVNYFDNFLNILSNIIITSEKNLYWDKIKNILDRLRSSAKYMFCKSSNYELTDFCNLICSSLESTPTFEANTADSLIEIVPVAELLGRRFDHVIFADVTHGILPRSTKPDTLLRDAERVKINQALRKNILRIYFEDPFEPMSVPPRQALEPFWFATALACADKSIWVSCAMRDHEGNEQAPSEFYLWFEKEVLIKNIPEDIVQFVNYQEKEFLRGCEKSKNISKEEPKYSYGAQNIEEAFAGRLGKNPTKVLTPTFIESFAQCSFYGLYTRILGLDSEKNDQDDSDPRVMGQLAHKTLEKFYKKKKSQPISKILSQEAEKYMANNFMANKLVFLCQVEWLKEALGQLVAKLMHDKLLINFEPYEFELGFGLEKSRYSEINIKINNKKYKLGGIIDRVDKSKFGMLIIDYKISGLASLKTKISKNNLLKSSFQSAVYTRLVGEYLCENKSEREKLNFIFISIRDNQIVGAPDFVKNKDLFAQIFDDKIKNSLASKINEIFDPISLGQAPARVCEVCAHCHLKNICRVSEAESNL